MIADQANAWYEEKKEVLDDGRFLQQYEKSVHKNEDMTNTWTLQDPSSDDSDTDGLQKGQDNKVRLLSSKVKDVPRE